MDGVVIELSRGMKVDRYKTHDIELVVDRMIVTNSENSIKRLRESMIAAMYQGNDTLMVLDTEMQVARYFSRNLMCPSSGISYPSPEPNSFSFNSPKGMCPNCKGLGCNMWSIPIKSFQIDLYQSLAEELNHWGIKKFLGV